MYKKIIIKTPGRACLFGDHQDYLGLPVITCAINRYITLEATLNNSHQLNINLPDIGKVECYALKDYTQGTIPHNYFLSGIKTLQKEGLELSSGYDITLSGNIPINSGLSSSSAILIAWIHFLLEAFSNEKVTPQKLAEKAFQAEVVEFDSAGGIMDQFSIAYGGLVYINTQNHEVQQLDYEGFGTLVIADSEIPKPTEQTLNEAKTKALEVIQTLNEKIEGFDIHKVADTELMNYRKLISKDLLPFFDSTFGNYEITKNALHLFRAVKIRNVIIGKLMTKHHLILKDKLNLTVPKIDLMIKFAHLNKVLGAKIVGSGKGGSIVVLTDKSRVKNLLNTYKENNIKAYEVSISQGSKLILKK